jgi:predicted nucleotidyltransferase component of viral defense system
MLKNVHRYSKDIDIFVPDPQTLGFVTPRLSDVAESITGKYVETADYVKLFLPEGEIDFVAAPNLTSTGLEVQSIMGRQVKVETSTEIIAKKLWHRGDQLTGRDIFDFARVTCEELDSMMSNSAFMIRHYDAIL